MHRRRVPFDRSFQYGITLIDIDIDRLDEAAKASPLFSVNRPNILSFYESDHGDPSRSLREWFDDMTAKLGLSAPPELVRLITFPRSMFYKFAPISIWLGLDRDKQPTSVVYEVNNTFGERHSYVGKLHPSKDAMTARKRFHVSPFFAVDGDYTFNVGLKPDRFLLDVENSKAGEPVHHANIRGMFRPLNTASILKHVVRSPLAGIGVTASIHLQAARLFLRGAKYHSRPALPDQSHTLIRPQDKVTTKADNL